jgi:hypothetical protein
MRNPKWAQAASAVFPRPARQIDTSFTAWMRAEKIRTGGSTPFAEKAISILDFGFWILDLKE